MLRASLSGPLPKQWLAGKLYIPDAELVTF